MAIIAPYNNLRDKIHVATYLYQESKMNEQKQTEYFSIKNISKTWKPPYSFSVTFNAEIKKGEMLGLLGKSGSGKSTVLRLVSGLLRCDEYAINDDNKNTSDDEKKILNPEIILDGKNITFLPPAEREIGMVFQNHALFPHLTVLDNVSYGLRFSKNQKRLSKKEAREKAYDFLNSFEMQNLASRFPEHLSGGEAQRVSLARTLITNPKVILFDEPFSSLDKPMTQKLLSDIKAMQEKTGFAGIFVSHNIEDAKNLCKKITVMKSGKQIWNGNAGDFDESLLN